MVGWYAPSEEELQSQGGDYDVLAEDEYLVKITSIEVKKDVINKYPSKNDSGPTHDMLVVHFDALTFANGDTLEDVDGKPLEGVVPFQGMLNPKKTGMIPQPSKTRKFFAAALGQPIGDKIAIDKWDDLVGKQLIASLKPNGSFNNPTDFRAIRKTRTRGTTTKGPVDGADLAKRAKEIFDEDSPTNTSPNPAADDTNDPDLDF